jgi:hypothetical protein
MPSGQQAPQSRRNGSQIGGKRFQEFAARLQTSAARPVRSRFRGADLLPAMLVNSGLTFDRRL